MCVAPVNLNSDRCGFVAAHVQPVTDLRIMLAAVLAGVGAHLALSGVPRKNARAQKEKLPAFLKETSIA